MRLLQVNNHGGIVGGVESYVADLSDLLKRVGIEVVGAYGIAPSPSALGRAARPVSHHASERHALADQAIFCPALVQAHLGAGERRRLRRLIEQLSPDAILVHQIESADVLELLCTLRPTVQFVHVQSRFICPGRGKFYAATHEPCPRPFGPYCLIAPYRHGCGSRRPWTILGNSWLTHRWIALAQGLDRLMVASEYMKRELIAVGIPGEKITVNPLFVWSGGAEVPTAIDECGQRVLGSEELPLVLFCGRMYDYKGAGYLLEALAHTRVPVDAVFVGDGPERVTLERQAIDLSLRHRLRFTGWLAWDAVRKLYRQARVLAMPSLWPEPFGRVGIEALAEGTPVVAFRVGAIPEWLADGEVGFLVEPRNIQQLAEKIECLVTDTRLFQQMSTRARALVAERFSPERHLQRLLDVIMSVRR